MKKGNVYLFVSIILAVITYATTILILDKKNIIDAGTFGDMFGALNTLFTGLAFVGVVISLFQQTEALNQQQQALTAQQEALKAQQEELNTYKTELETNTSNMKLQRMENTLFNLIEAHHKLVSDIRSNKVNLTGRTLIDYIFDLANKENLSMFDEEDKEESIVHFFSFFEDEYFYNINLAYDNYVLILSYIDNSDLDESEKIKFSKLLNAQLSLGQRYAYLKSLQLGERSDKPSVIKEERELLEKYL